MSRHTLFLTLHLNTKKPIKDNSIHVMGERKKFKSLDSSKNMDISDPKMIYFEYFKQPFFYLRQNQR
jgi:hypothetical protein